MSNYGKIRHRRSAGSLLVTISKSAALDEGLSYAARGLLLNLLGRSDGHSVDADSLSRAARSARGDATGESPEIMNGFLAELEQAGYIRRDPHTDALVVTDIPGCRWGDYPSGYDINAITFDEEPIDSPAPTQETVVYVVGDDHSSIVKIGITRNLNSRIQGLQSGSPHKLHVLCVFPGSIELEEHLHKRFAKRRMQGEWFDFTGVDSVALISQAAADFGGAQ